MDDRLVKQLSRAHTSLFRLSGGGIGSRLVGNDMLLLTTTGRVTGRSHTVPLLFLRDGGEFVVIASYGGRPRHPEWYRNLVAHPHAQVQVHREHFPVVAKTMSHRERKRWWPLVVDAYSGYAVYQDRTAREIPIVRLRRSADTHHETAGRTDSPQR